MTAKSKDGFFQMIASYGKKKLLRQTPTAACFPGSLGCQEPASPRHGAEEHIVGPWFGDLHGARVKDGDELPGSKSQVSHHRKGHQPLHVGGGWCPMFDGTH